VALAQGDPAAALATLTAYRRQAEANGWADERLRALILQALAQQALGEGETAVAVLTEAVAMAAPEGLIRPFVDEARRWRGCWRWSPPAASCRIMCAHCWRPGSGEAAG
jgi:hypothetical protein